MLTRLINKIRYKIYEYKKYKKIDKEIKKDVKNRKG